MLDEQEYVEQIDWLMKKLRGRCLGQNMPITDILPHHLKGLSPERQTDHLAEQFLFAMAKACSERGQIVEQSAMTELWLKKLILYLLTKCNAEGQTFQDLLRMVYLLPEIRKAILSNYLNLYCEELSNDPPPLFHYYDAAVLHLLNAHNLLGPAQEFYCSLQESLTAEAKQ